MMIKIRAYPELDTIRFISIILVVISHFFSRESSLLAWFSDHGSVGVDIFFVLSGFLITRILMDEYAEAETINLKRFWFRRALRLWPSWLFIFVIFLMSSPYYKFWWHYLFHFGNYSLIQNQAYQPYSLYWSLAVEEHFYFIWPILFILLNKIVKFKKLILSIVLLLPFVFRVYHSFNSKNPILIMFATHSRFDQPLAGCILALYFEHLPNLNWFKELLISLVIFLLFIISFYFLSSIKGPSVLAQFNYLVTALASCLLILVAMKGSDKGLRKLLKITILSKLGVLSYGVYLVHVLVLRPFLYFSFEKYAINYHLIVVIILVLSFIAAYLLYKLIEVPLAIYKNK